MVAFKYIFKFKKELLVIAFSITGVLAFAQINLKYKTPWFDPNSKNLTYCNLINIDYNFAVFDENSATEGFRSTADPVIVTFKGEYYLFATNQSGFYWSTDLGEWHFVYSGFQRLPADDDQCAPAAWVEGDTLFYMGSTYESLPVWFSTNPKLGRWQHSVDSTRLPAWDPGIFVDDDKRTYLYYGSSGTLPLKGVELDKRTFLPKGDQSIYQEIYQATDLITKQKAVGSVKEVIALNPAIHGWERFGMNNDDPAAPWGNFIEGAWMNKFNNTYYLQYAAPGTEFKVYADGTYVSDNPMGPFTYQKHNPVAYKPGGFIKGCGHGNTFADTYGNYWHTGTCMISVKHKFERRIGLYPAGFDDDGVMYVNTSYGDYPCKLPTQKKNQLTSGFTGWMLLSANKQATASSRDGEHNAAKAFDEDISTYWSANSEKTGEWLKVDLGSKKQIWAFQINYADHKTNQHNKAMDLYHQYQLLGSNDEVNWDLLVDKSYNDKDIPHDYVELSSPAEFRFIKLINIHNATGLFAIADLRVFGTDLAQAIPEKVEQFTVDRQKDDPRNAQIKWNPVKGAYSYQIFFGVAPNKLYSCITVNGESQYNFRGMDIGTTYYFSIEALNEKGISAKTEPVKID
ncbi:MAG: family 43 glycosylhydrolase [Salinivirgaceae bacterium]